CCRHQRGRVVDAVANEQCGRAFELPPGDRHLLLRRLAGIDLVDSDLLREVADLALPISGDEQHAVDLMPRSEVRDEGSAVVARRIMEPIRRRIAAVEEDDALESGRARW